MRNRNNNDTERRHSRLFTISLLRLKLSPTRTLKWPGHNRVQFTCNSLTGYHLKHVACLVVQWNRSATKFNRVEFSFYFSFILFAEPINRWRRGGNSSTRTSPLTTSFRKCHILKPENSSPSRDSNQHSSIGGRRLLVKQTCWPLHHTSPQELMRHKMSNEGIKVCRVVDRPTRQRSVSADYLSPENLGWEYNGGRLHQREPVVCLRDQDLLSWLWHSSWHIRPKHKLTTTVWGYSRKRWLSARVCRAAPGGKTPT